MEQDLLEQIQYDYPHLEIVETTAAINGYPSHIGRALIGFTNWNELEEILNKYNIDSYPTIITKHSGWNLWYRTNHTAFGPFENDSNVQNEYGDDYNIFNDKDAELDYLIDDIEYTIRDIEYNPRDIKLHSVSDIKKLIKDLKDSDDVDANECAEIIKESLDNYLELCDYFDSKDYDSFVLTHGGSYYDTIPINSMSYNFDSKQGEIAIKEE